MLTLSTTTKKQTFSFSFRLLSASRCDRSDKRCWVFFIEFLRFSLFYDIYFGTRLDWYHKRNFDSGNELNLEFDIYLKLFGLFILFLLWINILWCLIIKRNQCMYVEESMKMRCYFNELHFFIAIDHPSLHLIKKFSCKRILCSC